MQKVLCFGEALIDFLNTGSSESDGIAINQFNQFPGGAPANAAVAVAKLGGKAAFVGQVGQDMFGDFLKNCLQHYQVDTNYLLQHPSAKTALAFVALDEHGERSFSFYRQNSADILFGAEQINPAMFKDAGLLHICSNTLTDSKIADTTMALLGQAKTAGLTISFDVNLRHNLWAAGKADIQVVNLFVQRANVLKFSREEIDYLSDDIGAYVQDLLDGEAKLVVITNDAEPIHYYSQTCQGVLEAPKVNVVDTTAGGDAFSGGLLYQLSQETDLQAKLSDQSYIESLIQFAAKCGAHAVTKAGAFPALPGLTDVQ